MLQVARSNGVVLYSQRRSFLLAAALGVGSMVFGRESRLADAMGRGELHNRDPSYAMKKQEEVERRIKSLKDTRPMEPQYPGHVPLWMHEKMLLFAASGIKSYYHPEDGTNIVQLGESLAFKSFLERLKTTMLMDKTGRRILKERPTISEADLKMDKLALYPKNSLGYTFYKWLRAEGVTPDTRAPVTYIDDPVHAYIFLRYRQCHDFYHAISNLPIIIEGEIAVKALEAANIGVPMAVIGSLLAPLRLKPEQKKRLYDIYIPWAIETGLKAKPLINVYWEEHLDSDVGELRKELGIAPPPDLRAIRKEIADRKRHFKNKYEKY
ncbi:HEL175Cp [Eremothecium sinecaudum]|uniref:4-hydroxy-3-methoxy-5-polyprenylbenzoate decarboxylase n=1 Tax=Eremothecium sinecaudum TaxID=45286 RepID=A0A109UZE0_9SACH|nr:HEL175Cp [Eremothecium sinecaudum]AMD21106.1 HEL175Cp [Eremothecium sinecaudum]